MSFLPSEPVPPEVFIEDIVPALFAELELREAEERVDLRVGIVLTGDGGGVFTVRVHDGICEVASSFSERADVRYTADARIWCGVALGLVDAREVFAKGLLVKEGGREAMDRFFHQVSRPPGAASAPDVADANHPLERSGA